ncbi:cytosine permease [Salmonella enterica subsp. enterica]|uniref:Cytosine permease n=1 Tax=Salmonella enterica I TaxID=59201 RepID=A0A3S4HRS3_SALET|nr:cytosine permease [Salmonella enterica subsp. enterica]
MRRGFFGAKFMEALCRRTTIISQGPVPLAARKGVIPLTFVMLGLTFFSASMWTGGTLGTGLSYNDFFLAVFLR